MTFVGNPIHVRLKLASRGGGKAIGQFVLKGKRENSLPIHLVMQDDDTLTLELSQIGVTYEGRLRKAPVEITGTFAQAGLEAPLVLRPVTGSNQ
jgi:hypothetical protein